MQPARMFHISRIDGRFCLRASILAVIGALVLAASANAETSGAPAPGSAESPGVQEPVGAQGGSEEQTGTQETGGGQGAQEPTGGQPETPSTTQEQPTGEGAAGGEGPAGSEAPQNEAPQAQEPVISEPPAPETPQNEAPPVEQTSPEPTPTPVLDETPHTSEVVEEPKRTAPEQAEEGLGKHSGETFEEAGGGGSSSGRPQAPLDTSTSSQLSTVHVDMAQEAASPAGMLPTIATVTTPLYELAISEAQQSGSKRATMTPSQRAGRFSCELSALGGSASDNCAAGWLGAPRFPQDAGSTSPATAMAIAVSSLAGAASAGSPPGGGRGGMLISSPPVGPAPGPAPSGASGATSGVSGPGVSTFLTLAGLLLLGAPRAMRRLRLSCEPWLAGCFVLIPERPD
jgi:hypothetical protein